MYSREIQLGLKWRRDEGFACGLQGRFLRRCWATDRSIGHKLTHRRLMLNHREHFFTVRVCEH